MYITNKRILNIIWPFALAAVAVGAFFIYIGHCDINHAKKLDAEQGGFALVLMALFGLYLKFAHEKEIDIQGDSITLRSRGIFLTQKVMSVKFSDIRGIERNDFNTRLVIFTKSGQIVLPSLDDFSMPEDLGDQRKLDYLEGLLRKKLSN
ncbi:hypothetical protein [Bdellovibrio bacteriovorus]|uniref:hypothetical protein n=1 Tax=Bdellovibrio bacteriovorus TaxID=959 RepID=UPI0035A57133